jgi:hypothetical protein
LVNPVNNMLFSPILHFSSIFENSAEMLWQTVQDSQGRRSNPRTVRQKTDGTGYPGKDSRDRSAGTARSGQPGKVTQERTTRTGQPVKDRQGRKIQIGTPAPVSYYNE